MPESIEVVPVELIKKIADMLPKPEPKTSQHNAGGSEFSLDDWVSDKGLSVMKVSSWSGGAKYVLEECPFDSAHGKDAAIIRLNNGALAFSLFS